MISASTEIRTPAQFWNSLTPFDRIGLFPHFHPLTAGARYHELDKHEQESVERVFLGDLS